MDEDTHNLLQKFIQKIKSFTSAPIFLEPIEKVMEDFPLYEKIISQPIDLLKIEDKFENSKYSSIEEFNCDIQLMIRNCLTFNKNEKLWGHTCGVNFQKSYETGYEKLRKTIEDKNKDGGMLGKKRALPPNYKKSKNVSSSLKSNNSLIDIKNSSYSNNNYNNLSYNYKSSDRNKNSLINSNYGGGSNISVLPYDDKKISTSVINLFKNIRPHLKTSEENIDNMINTLIEGFSKCNKSSQDLYDIGTKFISKHLTKKDEKNIFMKDFSELIRNIKNKQKEESIKLDQKPFTIKIDLKESEANREEKVKLEKIRKAVKKFTENQRVPGIYLDREEYSIESDLKKKIYNFVLGLREEMTKNQVSNENVIIGINNNVDENKEGNNEINGKNKNENENKNKIFIDNEEDNEKDGEKNFDDEDEEEDLENNGIIFEKLEKLEDDDNDNDLDKLY